VKLSGTDNYLAAIVTQLALVSEKRNVMIFNSCCSPTYLYCNRNGVTFMSVELMTQLFLAQEAAENLVKEKAAAQEAQQKAIDKLQCNLMLMISSFCV
jgi:hypothetical protein